MTKDETYIKYEGIELHVYYEYNREQVTIMEVHQGIDSVDITDLLKEEVIIGLELAVEEKMLGL